MNEIVDVSGRDQKTGRFVSGGNGGPGRGLGSRNKLGEQFLSDLRDCWNEHGLAALRACAETEPGQFCRIVASLLPRDLNINLEIDATAFVEQFRSAQSMLGNPEPRRLRRPLPGQAVEHNNGRD